MSRTVFSTKKPVISTPEPIDVGGTGASDEKGIIAHLGIVINNEKDAASGIAILDENLKVKPENLPQLSVEPDTTVSGNFTEVFIYNSAEFQITNYDSARNYSISPVSSVDDAGSVALNSYDNMVTQAITLGMDPNFNSEVPPPGSQYGSCKASGLLTYTPPTEPCVGGFNINGKTFAVPVKKPYFEKPTIDYPQQNAIVTNSTIILNAWEGLFHGGSLQPYLDIRRIQWQIAEDSSFTLNLQTFTNDYTHLSQEIDDLVTNKLYYIRVRSTGWINPTNNSSMLLDMSEWSDTVSFATDITDQLTETQIVYDPAGTINNLMGKSVCLSGDGLLLATGESGKVFSSSVHGSIYLYAKDTGNQNTTTYQLSHEIQSPNSSGYVDFGQQVALSASKDIVFGTAPLASIAETLDGVAYMFDTTTHNLLYQINNPTPVIGSKFGRIIKAASGANVVGISDSKDRVHIFGFNTNGADLQSTLLSPDSLTAPYGNFGLSLDLSASGTRLVVGARDVRCIIDNETVPEQHGQVFVYDYDGSNWNLTASLKPDIINEWPHNGFGNQVAISPDGTEIFVGDDPGGPVPSLYIFKFVNNSWIKTQKIRPGNFNGFQDLVTSIAISSDAQTLAVGYDGGTRETVVILNKTNGNWNEGQHIMASDSNQYCGFANSLDMSADASIIAVGSFARNNGTINNQGAVYIYA